MRKRYRQKDKSYKSLGVLKVVVIIFLGFAAVKVGMIGGNALSGMDSNIVQHVDVNSFKMALNNSFPLIDTVYNSGNISVSVTGEIKNLVELLFDFDVSRPLTVLNSHSPILYSYYNKTYTQLAEKGEQEYIDYSKAEREDAGQKDEDQSQEDLKQQESSIAMEEDVPDKKTPETEGVISDGKIVVENETNYRIDSGFISTLLKEPLKIKFDKKGPKVLIFHTHTTESYLKDISELNKKNVPNRTSDARYNVVRVGEEIAQNLRKKGIEVIHNGKIHDYPSTNGAYGRSMDTVSKILKGNSSVRVVLDIHRDGLDDRKLRAVSRVNNKNAAQIMFVVGTNATGLDHPQWRENLKLAVKLQEKLNEKYPGLAKPIYVSKNRYNQHLSPGALIIEVGGDGNVLSECLESAKYISEAISDVVN